MIRTALGALLLTACTAQPASTGEAGNAASTGPVGSSPATAPPPAQTGPGADASESAAEQSGECDASKARGLVGREASDESGAEAKRLTGARAIRWIRPGQAVTMDYSPSRLNIKVDSNERIEGFDCG